MGLFLGGFFGLFLCLGVFLFVFRFWGFFFVVVVFVVLFWGFCCCCIVLFCCFPCH